MKYDFPDESMRLHLLMCICVCVCKWIYVNIYKLWVKEKKNADENEKCTHKEERIKLLRKHTLKPFPVNNGNILHW